METANYTIWLQPNSSNTVKLDRITEKLQQRGFEEIEALNSNGLHFVLNKPAYDLQAHLEAGDNGYVQRVSVSLDTRRLLVDAVSSAATELSGVVCGLAHYDDKPQMAMHYADEPGGQPQDGLEFDNPCDLCNRFEQGILQKKQSLRKFPAVSAEDALKWMEDFPQRKDKFVAAVREGKD